MNSAAPSDGLRHAALHHLLDRDLLWDDRFLPESNELLGRLWAVLDEDEANRLLATVMAGPRDEDDAEEREDRAAHRLSAMARAGARPLPPEAEAVISRVRERRLMLRASLEEGTLGPRILRPARQRLTATDLLALDAAGIVAALTEDSSSEGLSDAWTEAVAKRLAKGAEVLREMSARGVTSSAAWRDTLSGLARVEGDNSTFAEVARTLIGVGDDLLADPQIGWAVGWWLPDRAKALAPGEEGLFLELWERLYSPLFRAADTAEDNDADPLTAAFNEPPGRMTEALIHRYFAAEPTSGGGLPPALQPLFERIVAGGGRGHRVGRVTLFRFLSTFHWNDPEWTGRVMIPRLSWSDPDEAAALWRAFISGGRIDADLFAAIKPEFLTTIRDHASDVHGSADFLFQFLMIACLDLPGQMTDEETREILLHASPEGRRSAARWLARVMPGDPMKGATAWRDRYGPWFHRAWPKNLDLRDAETGGSLAAAALKSGDAFPEAFEAIQYLAVPSPQVAAAQIHRLAKTTLPTQHPATVVSFLDALAPPAVPDWSAGELRPLLDAVIAAKPDLKEDAAFKRLSDDLRRLGG